MRSCPVCLAPVIFALGWHGLHQFVQGHLCPKGGYLVQCWCGAEGWGKDRDEALAAIGGTYESPQSRGFVGQTK